MSEAGRSLPPSRDDTPAVEQAIVFDMLRRSLPVLPVFVLVAWLIWEGDGAFSAAFAIGLVVVNFLFSAALLAWSARINPSLLMVAALGGFVLRLALIAGAFFLVKDQDWMELVPFGLTLILTHLGLLIWETRHLSISLTFPAVKPPAPERG